MEAEAFTSLGIWKTWEEMEESLTLEELRWMLNSIREKEDKQYRFQAAIAGAEIGDREEPDADFDAVKRRAEAKLAGRSEEQLHLDELGIGYEVEGG
jgi:hypothetical protein